jgi:hypothetical protein
MSSVRYALAICGICVGGAVGLLSIVLDRHLAGLPTSVICLSGLALGLLLIVFTRFWEPAQALEIFALVLIGMPMPYLLFAIHGAPLPWLGLEGIGLVLFGSMGWGGLRGSPRLVALGWALHSVWDVGLHWVGPGARYTVHWYPVVCLCADLSIAVYVACVYMWPGDRQSAVRLPTR